MKAEQEFVHKVAPGETPTGIGAKALSEAFGAPHTPKEWVERGHQVKVETDAIAHRNGIKDYNFDDSGNDNFRRGTIKPEQMLYIPDPKELFNK